MSQLGIDTVKETPTRTPGAGPSAGQSGDVTELLLDPALGARPLEATTGTVLADDNDPARSVFFIHTGQVRVYQTGPENSARLLEILGPGDWFGVPALAGADVYGTRAVAVSAVTVSEVPAENWLA